MPLTAQWRSCISYVIKIHKFLCDASLLFLLKGNCHTHTDEKRGNVLQYYFNFSLEWWYGTISSGTFITEKVSKTSWRFRRMEQLGFFLGKELPCLVNLTNNEYPRYFFVKICFMFHAQLSTFVSFGVWLRWLIFFYRFQIFPQKCKSPRTWCHTVPHCV